MGSIDVTERTRVRRLADRGVYEKEVICSILDEAFLCHLGFVLDGQPYVIPTAFARKDDAVYLHGSAASRIMRLSKEPVPVCVTVTLVDGLVVARSAFHSSMNYRSVVVLGQAQLVTDSDEKWDALRLITNHILPGRAVEARPMTEREVKGTGVFKLALNEASAKVRTGGPKDDEEDYALPIWAGVIPLKTIPGEPIPDDRVLPGVSAFDPARLAQRGKHSV